MLGCILLRPRLRFSRRRRWNNGLDFIFFDEHISIVGLDLEHVVFVGDDHAVKFLAVLQANLIRPRAKTDRAERQNQHRRKTGAALIGDSHKESIPPPRAGRNLHTRGGVRRATSASSALVRATSRSISLIVELRRARSGSGSCACVCCSASASAIMRICPRLRGFNRSQSRLLLLRFRPSHSSTVPAGRPVSGSATGAVFCFLGRIMKFMSSPSPRSLVGFPFFNDTPTTE